MTLERLDAAALRRIVEASADCIKVLDLDARLVSMNAGGQAVMEIDDFDVCRSLLWSSFWPAGARPRVEAALDEARAGGTATFEESAATFKGNPRRWEVRVSPLLDGQGHVTGLLAVSRDVTERFEAQQANARLLATLERRVTERTAALDAFVAFTEASTRPTDVLELAERAGHVLEEALGVTLGYSVFEDGRWKGRVFSGGVPESVRAAARAGFDADLPGFALPVETRDVVFVDGWNAEGADATHIYGAAALYPFFQDDVPVGMLTMGTARPGWAERERAVFRSVGHSLALALERAAIVRRLDEERDALDAFVAFVQAVGAETDPLELARQAGLVLHATLPDVGMAYYEQSGEFWRASVHSADLPPGVLARIRGGIPRTAPVFASAVTSTEPAFYSEWDAHVHTVPAAEDYHAVALFPCTVHGHVSGLLTIGKTGARKWTPREQAVFRAVGRALTGTLERSANVVRLAERTAELERRTVALETANEELEAFSYSASHDLRTPVRHVVGFLGMARTALGDRLDAKTARYLDVIEQAGHRMNALIDAMLLLSQVSRAPLRLGPTDLGALVERARTEYEADTVGRTVHWQVGPLPLVYGDRDTLAQVVTNLLGNALKFTRTRAEAVIEVWADDRPDEWRVSVRDNGVGFDPRYRDKLFGVFQRLHREEEFEGTGVGLANVRRIVARHGGKVFASGTPGEGATFGFTLPKPGEAQA